MFNPQHVRSGERVSGPAKTADPSLGPVPEERPATVAMATADPGLFQDVPTWIWGVFLSAWATLFGLFILLFATDAESAFVITIAALFGLMAFGLPMTLAAQSNCDKCSYGATIDTHTGPLSVGAAAAQIVLIPVGAVIGLIAFIALAK